MVAHAYGIGDLALDWSKSTAIGSIDKTEMRLQSPRLEPTRHQRTSSAEDKADNARAATVTSKMTIFFCGEKEVLMRM